MLALRIALAVITLVFAALLLQSNDTIIPSEGNDEMQTSLHEMQETVKDLEQKVADLFMHNVSLKTKLTASREVEKEHKQSITNLEERLVQALEAQVLM